MNNDDENKTQIMLVMIIHIYTEPIQKDKVIKKDKVKFKVMREEFIGFFIILVIVLTRAAPALQYHFILLFFF